MRTSAIICEFNPLHIGHERLIQYAKENGADKIVCIMSGNFVQRGEPAVADKYTRAKAAILSGADLVLEMPLPFSSASAEYFAKAGVYIADRLGFVDELIFGSELGNISALEEIAEKQLSPEFRQRVSHIYTGELGFPASAEKAYEELYGRNDALKSPNNILAIEYIKALKRLGSPLAVRTIERFDNYSSDEISGKYPSASALRKLIEADGFHNLEKYMPKGAYEALEEAEKQGLFPINTDKYGFALLSFLRISSAAQLSEIEGISGGLENRIIQSALSSTTYEELLKNVATKKYTDARLRRALLFSLFGIIHSDMSTMPIYVNLLAAGNGGRELLSRLRKNDEMWVVTKASDKKRLISELTGFKKADAERLYELEKKADAIYSLCLEPARDAGFFERKAPLVEK